ncbi:MAG: 4Fe-4S dicluster domain-containing protein [Roseibacillus sp.]
MSTDSNSSSVPQRWDSPFDPLLDPKIIASLLQETLPEELPDEAVRALRMLIRVKSAPALAGIDPARFPPHLSLDGILLNDARLLAKDKNEIILREGDYGNSAFVILRGSATLIADKLPGRSLGRGSREQKGFLAMVKSALRRKGVPEARVHHTERFEDGSNRGDTPSVFLQDVPRVLDGSRTYEIQAGEMFGEIAALGRCPRNATIISAEANTEILEIRWQGLRDLMSFAPEFKEHVEDRYRQYGLRPLLLGLDIIRRLDPVHVETLVKGTRFERHGRFDWYGTYQKLLSASSAADRLRSEPMILPESDYINGMMIVRGGFVRVSHSYHGGEKTVSYLGMGQTYGLTEILHNHAHPDQLIPAQHSLRAIGYVDILVIPTHLVEECIIPSMTPSEVARHSRPLTRLRDTDDIPLPDSASMDARELLGPGIMDFLMDKRTINGSAAMLIDLDRCTRCDDCVQACASTHDGNPRFIRYGDHQEGIQVAQACLHCHDPICMIPCPTGAIHREDTGEVVINDSTCIGCSSCASNCPYDNIQMVEIRNEDGLPQFPSHDDQVGGRLDLFSEGALKRATKCDLCFDQKAGPACVRACPHDALQRFDMQDIDSVARWLSR